MNDPFAEYDDTGVSRAEAWQRDRQRMQAAQRNFVAPAAPLATPQPVTIDAGPAWLAERPPLDLARGWQTLEGTQEHTSAMDRAQALRVRLAPFLWAWALLSVIVGAVVLIVAQNTPGAALGALLTFAGLTAVTYYKLNRTDYVYSREGTERHKVDTAVDLAREQMRHEQELRKMALEAYLDHLQMERRRD